MKFIKIKAPFGDFEMQETLVTQVQWEEVMKENPSYFKDKNNPVETVSYEDIEKFCDKLNQTQKKFVYRLPTEEEWEFACGKIPKDIEAHAWCWENSKQNTHLVKKKKPNEFGLYDMLGNVWEWTSTTWDSNSSYRVLRGGSWLNDAQYLRSAYRYFAHPGYRVNDLGFRLVRDLITPGAVTLSPSESESDKVAVEAIEDKFVLSGVTLNGESLYRKVK